MSGPSIRRAFASIGGQHLHYRWAGSGAPLVLLHQSPQCSAMWLERMPELAQSCRVLTPDLPGLGWSDPVPAGELAGKHLTIDSVAALLHAWLDQLGIGRCVVFGMHTGGLVAVAMGLLRPERCAAILVDGYACFSAAEQAELGEHYLPPLLPSWDGAHLRWLWARMREQLFHFPWFRQTAEAVTSKDAPDLATTSRMVEDLLRAGDHYRPVYRAALSWPDRHRIAELCCPARLFYVDGDPLCAHAARLPALPGSAQIQNLPDRPTMWRLINELLPYFQVDPAPPVPGQAGPRQLLQTACGEIAVRLVGEDGPLSLRLHAPASWPEPNAVAHPAGAGRRILVELPGHGASSEQAGDIAAARVAEALIEVAETLAPTEPFCIEAEGASVAVAVEIAERLGSRCRELRLDQPWLLTPDECAWLLDHLPDATPRPAGGHLLELWQWAREAQLYPPWRAPTAASRWQVDAPDPEQVQRGVQGLYFLKERLHELFADWLRPDLDQRLLALTCAVSIRVDPARDDGRLAALAAALNDPSRSLPA